MMGWGLGRSLRIPVLLSAELQAHERSGLLSESRLVTVSIGCSAVRTVRGARAPSAAVVAHHVSVMWDRPGLSEILNLNQLRAPWTEALHGVHPVIQVPFYM